jgi:hypothetical protein
VRKRRTWRTRHFAGDEATGDIVAETLTDNSVDAGAQVSPLVDQVASSLRAFAGDGASDKQQGSDTLRARGPHHHQTLAINIPPRRDAKIWQHGNCQAPPPPRDENLRDIRKSGRQQWQREGGYHRRSLAETTVCRDKRILGEQFSCRTMETQRTEARIGCQVLNRMTQLGMPNSSKVVA